MSRIPQRQPSRSSIKTPSTPSKSRVAGASSPAPVRARTQSTPRSATPVRQRVAEQAPPPPVPAPSMSIKEVIALRRAEAKKAQAKLGGEGGGLDNFVGLEDALPTANKHEEEEDILGRLPVRDTIEQARSTGILNLATRSLPCLPSALFEIHLGITPDRLKSVPDEPVLPPSDPENETRKSKRNKPAWFEAQDLTVLKAWNNEIVEIQHELSLFGSLKTVDLHKNKLSSLPNTFSDLASLTVLDLSYNALTTLPENLFALPELTTLNLSHNLLTSLPFEAPFASAGSRTGPNQYTSTSFFTPAVLRATTPLPRLVILDASHNRIVGSAIDATIPVSLTKIDLSGNPLGPSQRLIQALGALKRLKEAKFEKAEIGDDSFPPGLFSFVPFVDLRLFDLGETQATLEAVQAALRGMKQELNFDFTTDGPPMGVTRILVGKKIVKEPWELELERRAKAKADKTPDWETSNSVTSGPGSKGEIVKEDWEIEAEQGLLTEGAKRRARAAVTATTAKAQATAPSVRAGPSAVVKEAWEVEAEQGLLTEGGKRRARAAAAAAQAQARAELGVGQSPAARPSSTSPQGSISASLSNPQYYTATTQTLKLPASAAPTKGPGHARAFSLAAPSAAAFSSSSSPSTTDITVPAPSLPLSVIVVQPFADTLRVLILANRRMDRSFSVPKLPEGPPGFLPKLEELDLEGCNLSDFVSVHATEHTNSDGGGETTPPRSSEPIIPTLSKLFPSLQTLNLSYNALTNASLNPEALSLLILTSPHRRGLRHLRLRGNRISDLDGFIAVAEQFKGNREVPGWKMEELDLRDNEIGKLPPELGLLPLDVLLVDGNTFRVPQRRVWEREGTKGLLSWLRGRIE